jgi:hypothetical protein
MNEEINLEEMSSEALEDLNIALGNQIMLLKQKRTEINRLLDERKRQAVAKQKVKNLSKHEREALLQELTNPQPIRIGLKPGVVGAKGQEAGG